MTELPLARVQENVFYTCSCCGAMVMIDKDEAMKLLTALAKEPR